MPNSTTDTAAGDLPVYRHERWSSRLAFILAAAGSAVGLGNIWKFPYITGENGGGAFVLVYLFCIAFIGLPILMAEILLGRRGRQSPMHTMAILARQEGQSPAWQIPGWTAVAGAFLILSFYSVIAGWALVYVWYAVSGAFSAAAQTPEQAGEMIGGLFSGLLGSPAKLLFWHSLFMAMTVLVVARGVKAGLEKAATTLMPALLALLIVMVGYAVTTGKFGEGVGFLFRPDFSKLSWGGVLIALGHAFFTLSLATGAIMAYGSYLPREVSIARASITVAVMDTVVALLAGLAIFPIVFANGLEPGAGPGLIFVTLPIAFGQMPLGLLFGTLFFILLVFAAWTSSISLLEPVVEYLEEHRGVRRVSAAIGAGIAAWLLGIATVLSFNVWSDFTPLAMFERFEGKTLFDLLDYLTANLMMPITGLLIALFAGWAMAKTSTQEELQLGDGAGYRLWRFTIRYIAPLCVIVVLLSQLGLI